MKPLSTVQQHLLSLLANGELHSGENLGATLNLSRTAIWKHINYLIELGVPIQCHTRKGYQLRFACVLLEASSILNTLDFSLPESSLTLLTSVDSTNRYLKTHDMLSVCCAEMQTAGRGRFGRTWRSPFGENIYCSTRWRFECDISRLSGLSLVVSLALLSSLAHLKLGIQLKWPNDLIWADKKFSGCLIEIMAETHACADVIIGLGLNVNSSEQAPAVSLHDITGQYFDRNRLIAQYLMALNRYIAVFKQEGLSPFIKEFNQVDYLRGKQVTVSNPTGNISGIAVGINEAGQLMLEDDERKVHYLSSGDSSIGSS